ncbi:50S ribosomal protein L11 methyltransferase [Oleiagrimonas sp. C23AA]|uniref:50S ribosomal protein L11 methyltransferase n=1 Tax=Oleiagrimonas sp. C23AA TaxID=2719047 RepID=UPI0014216B35|nr:50S ribosomal protein L11 methyltransferase [Oleiagrimonas sp. C23AA]NII12312.1 50S ribosomal protein L11 methyltransferase [Oleiagrimonas sp. C23AA]
MPWLELSLTVTAAQQPAVESALEALGAQAITLADADAETPDERAIFEPGVGETPLWQGVVLNALFDADADQRALSDALGAQVAGLSPEQISFRRVEDQDWERAWMDQFQPMRFGHRLWIHPWNYEGDTAEGAVVVHLDPGLAFGTGTHPTTALCLEWLDGLALSGKRLIDYGCGSGVLALAALKLGAAQAIGVDNDPQALSASADNASRNGVGERLSVYLPEDAPTEPADVFVANILAGPLLELVPRFAELTGAGAPFALSGILNGQHEELLEAYAPWFEDLSTEMREDWVRISGRRKA